MTHRHRGQLLPEKRTHGGQGRRPQTQRWWQQKLWFMKSWLVTQGVASSLQLTGGQAGTLTFEPLIMSYISLVPLDSLIHLLRGQLASIFGNLRVQDVPYLFLDSIQGNLILEGLKLFVCQLILPIFVQVTHRGTYPY